MDDSAIIVVVVALVIIGITLSFYFVRPMVRELRADQRKTSKGMSQEQSLMFSDAVYVFGNTFDSAPSWLDAEELPNGTKVSQKTLAVQVVLAAFAYLYNSYSSRSVMYLKRVFLLS
jgi:hypothetical protein